jgi:putative restriction endonuclease
MEKLSIIIANITWNPDGWRNTYTNPHAGHLYARDTPGHECLNFKFDKPIDKNGNVHGYVQWTFPPKKFLAGGIVIFYSRNLKTNKGEIVGIYGKAEIIKTPIETDYLEFGEDKYLTNIIAEERFSMLFPIPLSEKKYKQIVNTKRLVPQIGFRLIDDQNLAKAIINDEIIALKRSGIKQDELKKLASIYKYITGDPYKGDLETDYDAEEQDEIIKVLNKKKEIKKEDIARELKKLKPTDPEIVILTGKTYGRDNKTIAELKFLRDFKCQICGTTIIKKDNTQYIEAAHITQKKDKGPETPDNILILCPNHHKEFDFGDKQIIKRNKEKIIFILNSTKYEVSLALE